MAVKVLSIVVVLCVALIAALTYGIVAVSQGATVLAGLGSAGTVFMGVATVGLVVVGLLTSSSS
ncbi:hypothetical protein OOK13_44865 [Streptomyces sp. NBC_00378]|uniref:hypothetical protein n=1 Tax=unclassified Streptomyces TaxID=2593676 RepID=UPI00224FD7AB|nr:MULTISPECIES: hypothetical protein [unclassified Streptomyces]MCX5115434.1 hypothetical protein [Streptomyces sp. NBC_00378]